MSSDLCIAPQTTSVTPVLDGNPTSRVQSSDVDVQQAKIAVVDDEPTNVKVICRLLNLEGYNEFVSTTDSRQAIELVERETPDMLLLDLMMPHVSGLDILSRLRSAEATRLIPVVILTASTDHDTRIEALNSGANDFLNKPIDPSELAPRIQNLLLLKLHKDQLRDYSEQLEQAVRKRTAELEASRRDLIQCLARAAEYRDDDTGHHILRVGKYARLIAERLGIAPETVDVIEQAAQLHDVGKIGIPDDVLCKPGKLTASEFEVMQRHCGFGKRILQRMSPEEELAMQRHADMGAELMKATQSPVLEMATRIALTHHEWWDGRGYPLGLKGEDIPLEGRIVAVADVFDALSTKRCYKEAFPVSRCFEIMAEQRETHFDPAVLDAFVMARSEITEVQLRYAEEF